MLIILELDAPRNDIDAIKEKILSEGCTPHEIPGESKLAIGITGPTNLLREENYRKLSSVENVVRVTEKYKLVSRQMKQEDTVIQFGDASFGGKELGIIAGPCAVESRDQIMEIAHELSEMGIKFLRGGAFKPRSSPYSFQGLKSKGLEYLDEVKQKYGMKIVTEALNTSTIGEVAEVADIIQIGARNMQNFTLLEEAGKINKPILLKRGLSAKVEDLQLSAEYILAQNNYDLILCERGIRTFETATRNTLDLNAIPVIKKKSHLPVIVDPSHGIGIREAVSNMAIAAVAAGADGLIIEVHAHPEDALSDGYQSLSPREFKELLSRISELAPIVQKEFNYDK